MTPRSRRHSDRLGHGLYRALILAIPIAGGLASRNLLGVVDTLMVGRLGEAALAGVGIAAALTLLASALVTGIGAGVQVRVARQRGASRAGVLGTTLGSGLVMALVVSLCVAALTLSVSDPLLHELVQGHPAVMAAGLPYLDIRLLGLPAVGLSMAMRGYLFGLRLTREALLITVAVHAVNIAISYVLIFGAFGAPRLGTAGAAIGTVAALYLGALLYAGLLVWRHWPKGPLRPSRAETRLVLATAVPTSLQATLYAASYASLFAIAGLVGVTALAVTNILATVVKVAAIPAMGFSRAAITLVAEAVGRRDAEAARRVGWAATVGGLSAISALSAVLLLFPEAVLSAFTGAATVIESGAFPKRVVGLTLLMETLAIVLTGAMTGAGRAGTAMRINVCCQWLVGVPLAYLLAVPAGLGVDGLWIGWGLFRLTSAGMLAALWWRGAPIAEPPGERVAPPPLPQELPGQRSA